MSVIKFDSLAPQNCLLKCRPPQLVDAVLIQLLMCSAWQGPLVERYCRHARAVVRRGSLERFFQNVHRMVHDYDIFKPRLSDNSTECMKYGVFFPISQSLRFQDFEVISCNFRNIYNHIGTTIILSLGRILFITLTLGSLHKLCLHLGVGTWSEKC